MSRFLAKLAAHPQSSSDYQPKPFVHVERSLLKGFGTLLFTISLSQP